MLSKKKGKAFITYRKSIHILYRTMSNRNKTLNNTIKNYNKFSNSLEGQFHLLTLWGIAIFSFFFLGTYSWL